MVREMFRADIERQILDDERALSSVARLVREGTPLSAWPGPSRLVLLLALAGEAGRGGEAWKASALRRHLFGPEYPVVLDALIRNLPNGTDDELRSADRVRADLIGLVALRAGRALLR